MTMETRSWCVEGARRQAMLVARKTEKGKEMDSTLKPPEGTSPVDTCLNPSATDFRPLTSRTIRYKIVLFSGEDRNQVT